MSPEKNETSAGSGCLEILATAIAGLLFLNGLLQTEYGGPLDVMVVRMMGDVGPHITAAAQSGFEAIGMDSENMYKSVQIVGQLASLGVLGLSFFARRRNLSE